MLLISSSIAARSLASSCLDVIHPIENNYSYLDIQNSRKMLSNIVGRDTSNLKKQEILRAVAETASENAVDGIFAPLFWIFIGIMFWKVSLYLPGPLSFVLTFKASSTIDSMIGYKEGSLRWIGYTGAKLDDLMTWIPSRLVLITLPLVSRSWNLAPEIIKKAWKEGSKDESPNSGLSEAIFANCLKIRMGGENIYRGKKKYKPELGKNHPEANTRSIKKIILSIVKLQIFWLLLIVIINLST